MNLSRLFHCSVIKVLCSLSLRQLLHSIKSICLCQQLFHFSLLSFQATACSSYHQRSALSTTFLFFFVVVSSDSLFILPPAIGFVNNFFLPIQKFFKNWLSHPMPSVVLTFLLYVPPHQRQLAYNSTAAGRSQHISGGFVEVGHLAVFTAIVWIVPIICAILIFVACGENLEYGKRHQLFVFPANNRSARKITGDAFTLWFRKFSLHNATSFNCVPHAHITIGYNILLRCACKTQSFTEPLAPEGASDFFIYIVIVIHKNISH